MDEDFLNLGGATGIVHVDFESDSTDSFTIDLGKTFNTNTVTWKNTTDSLDDIWATNWKVDKKPSPKITFNEDPIAVVLALKAMNICGSEIYNYMDPGADDDIFPSKKNVYEYDITSYIEQASEIREYYKMKLVTSALLGTAKTEFRKALGEILTNEDGVYTREHIPIFIRLPDFYEEDIFVEKLIEPLEAVKRRSEIVIDRDFEHDLTYIDKVKQCRRSSTRYRYAFKDMKDELYIVTVNVENNLQGVLDYLCTSKGTLRVKGQRNLTKLYGHNFNCYEVNRFTIEG
jgi:hypothetical protein